MLLSIAVLREWFLYIPHLPKGSVNFWHFEWKLFGIVWTVGWRFLLRNPACCLVRRITHSRLWIGNWMFGRHNPTKIRNWHHFCLSAFITVAMNSVKVENAQVMLQQMYWTNLSGGIKAKYSVSWLRPSLETPGQIVRQTGNWGKWKTREEGEGKKEDRVFCSPQFPTHPTICPWVSEDGLRLDVWRMRNTRLSKLPWIHHFVQWPLTQNWGDRTADWDTIGLITFSSNFVLTVTHPYSIELVMYIGCCTFVLYPSKESARRQNMLNVLKQVLYDDPSNSTLGLQRFLALRELGPTTQAAGGKVVLVPALQEQETSGTQHSNSDAVQQPLCSLHTGWRG